MKSSLILLIFVFSSARLGAQNIENASFDSAYIGGIDRIYNWITSDSWVPFTNDTVQPMEPDSHFVSVGFDYHMLLQTAQLEYSNAFDGPLAIKLFSISNRVHTDGTPFKGFVTNGNHFFTNSLGYIDFKKGGTPFTSRPSKLRGHFKFDNTSPSLTNFGKASVLLKKFNSSLQQSDTIGYAESSLQFFPTGSWTLFELPITYYSNQNPDSVVVVFQSSVSGLSSTFILDSLGFYYPNPSGVSNEIKREATPYVYDAIQQIIFFSNGANLQSVKLLDSNGKLIRVCSPSTSQLGISSLNEGVYFLEIGSKGKQKVYKIIK